MKMEGGVQFLGKDQHGIVFLVCPLNDSLTNACVAVKITYTDRFVREAAIATELAVLKPDTQAFVATLRVEHHVGILPKLKATLPRRKQTGEVINWAKYENRALTYIYMEYSNHRMFRESPSAPVTVFWEFLEEDEVRKVFFILLHGLYVARRKLGFAHNNLHNGNIVLFQRNPSVPICLGNGYQITNCRFMPKFIGFGSSDIKDRGDPCTNDVARLLDIFGLTNKFDLKYYNGIHIRYNSDAIGKLMLQFPEFCAAAK